MKATPTHTGRHSDFLELSRRRVLAAVAIKTPLATPGKPGKQPPPIKPPGPDRPPYESPDPNEPPHDPPVEPPGPDQPPLEPPDKTPPIYAMYVAALRSAKSVTVKR